MAENTSRRTTAICFALPKPPSPLKLSAGPPGDLRADIFIFILASGEIFFSC